MNPITELELLSSDGIHNMSKIEWWLLKYYGDYKKMKDAESKRFTYFIDGKCLRLPDYFDARTTEERFLEIYDILNQISICYRNEDYFKQEMAIYKAIEKDYEKVIQWLAKNEELGARDYVCFSNDYFCDEEKREKQIHLKLFTLGDKDVFADRDDFKNTIEFLNNFNNIYWNLIGDLKSIKDLL